MGLFIQFAYSVLKKKKIRVKKGYEGIELLKVTSSIRKKKKKYT